VRSRLIFTTFMVRRCRRKRCPGLPIRSWRRWRNGRIVRWIRCTWRSPVDAIVVKVREGQVANRPVYAAIGVTLEGHKDVLGLTMGTGGGEGYGTSTGSFDGVRAAA
jgi:Transposase, Mutator family